MSMSVQDLPEATRNAILDGNLRKMAQDPSNWTPHHPGYAEVIDDMAAHRRKESAATIDNIVAITVPDLLALKIAVKTNTSMTTFKDQRLQRHLWIESIKEAAAQR